ncbi:unnamed protein product [Cuscuta epithymum]|uniref:Tetraspanin n=1 Tax=Cuscuta epithymum TaxID=186058 RepID=A0AAV0GHQ1_9ASTE|nr:unnamed protein product [Cuscuta epithymum]
MAGITHKVTGIIILLVGIISAFIIIFLARMRLESKIDQFPCFHISQSSQFFFLGALILAASVIGCVLFCCYKKGMIKWLLLAYWVSMILLIVWVAYLVYFMYKLSAIQDSGAVATSRTYSEYHLNVDGGGIPGWLLRRVTDGWDSVAGCLGSSDKCAVLSQKYPMAQDFFNATLTPFQSGCCKPPTPCEFQFVNATNWIAEINPRADADCTKWSNAQAQLCYTCDSCKAGLVATVRSAANDPFHLLLLALVLLIGVIVLGVVSAYVKPKKPKAENDPGKQSKDNAT